MPRGGQGVDNVLATNGLEALNSLPDDLPLSLWKTAVRHVHVQSDALLTLARALVLIETKNIRRSPSQVKCLVEMSMEMAVAGAFALARAESGKDWLAAEDLMETTDEVFSRISGAETDASVHAPRLNPNGS